MRYLSFFFFLFQFIFSSDFIFIRSAKLDNNIRYIFDFSYHRSIIDNNKPQYSLSAIDFSIRLNATKKFQLGLTIPIIYANSLINDIERLPVTLGDIYFNVFFSSYDKEYKFFHGFNIRYQLDSSVDVEKLNFSNLDQTAVSYYPFNSSQDEFAIGWYFQKNWNKANLQINFDYIYEFNNGEKISDLFDFNSGLSEAERNQNGDSIGVDQFTIFGLIDTAKRFFWRTSLLNPWADKNNDHLDLRFSFDYLFNTPLFIKNKKYNIAFNPFLEILFLIPFSSRSFYPRQMIGIPGLALKIGEYINYQFGISFSFLNRSRNFLRQNVFIKLSVLI